MAYLQTTPYPVSPWAVLAQALTEGVQAYNEAQQLRLAREAQELQLKAAQAQLDAANRQAFRDEQQEWANHIDRLMAEGNWDKLSDQQKTEYLLKTGRPAPITSQTVSIPGLVQPTTQPLTGQLPVSAVSAAETQSTRVLPTQSMFAGQVSNLPAVARQKLGLTDPSFDTMKITDALALVKAGRETTEWAQENTPLGQLYANDPAFGPILAKYPMLAKFTHKAISPQQLFNLSQTQLVSDLDPKLRGMLGIPSYVPKSLTLDQGLALVKAISEAADAKQAAALKKAAYSLQYLEKKYEDNPMQMQKDPLYAPTWRTIFAVVNSGQDLETEPPTPTAIQATDSTTGGLFSPMVANVGTTTSRPTPNTVLARGQAQPTPTASQAPGTLPPEFEVSLATPAPANGTSQTVLEAAGGDQAKLQAAGIDPLLWNVKVSDLMQYPAEAAMPALKLVAPSFYTALDKKLLRERLDSSRRAAEQALSQANIAPGAVRSYVQQYNNAVAEATQKGYLDLVKDYPVWTDVEKSITQAIERTTPRPEKTFTVKGRTYTTAQAWDIINSYNQARQLVEALESTSKAERLRDKTFTRRLAEAKGTLATYDLDTVRQLQAAVGAPQTPLPPPPGLPEELEYTEMGPDDAKADKRTQAQKEARTAAVGRYIANVVRAIKEGKVSAQQALTEVSKDRKWFNSKEWDSITRAINATASKKTTKPTTAAPNIATYTGGQPAGQTYWAGINSIGEAMSRR